MTMKKRYKQLKLFKLKTKRQQMKKDIKQIDAAIKAIEALMENENISGCVIDLEYLRRVHYILTQSREAILNDY